MIFVQPSSRLLEFGVVVGFGSKGISDSATACGERSYTVDCYTMYKVVDISLGI